MIPLRMVIILTAMSLALGLSVAEAQVTAITAGRLVDPETGTVRDDQTIVIEDGKILAVGDDPTIPDGAEQIDLSSLTVLPGLIDSHTHLAGSYDFPASNLKEYNVDISTAQRAIQGLLNAQSMLATGFTTVRDLGNGGHFADTALARWVNAPRTPPKGQVHEGAAYHPGRVGPVLGPTMYVSGKIISVFGGQFRVSPDYQDVGLRDYFYADSRDEMLKAIRQNLHYGATWIKIVVDDYRYLFSADDIRFMVEEAERAGVRVAAHAVTDEGARLAIEGGVASIEHGYLMTDETLELAKARGIVLVGCDLADEMAQAYRGEIYRLALDRLKRAHRIGIEMAFGSDILMNREGLTRGQLSLAPIDTWAEAGIPPADTLRAMITNGARLLGVADERGAIRPGMAADIIGTLENPLDGIEALKGVTFVMKDGVVFRRD